MKRTLILMYAANLLIGTGVAHADVVLHWNAIMQTTVAEQNPFAQARIAAITQLAVFEAVNAIADDYEPYLGTIEAPAGASADAAAIAAAYRVLKTYFPSNTTLDAARASSLAGIPESQGKSDGISVGEAAAAAMIALRTNDGSAPPQFYQAPPYGPGEWQPTAGCPPAGGILLHWRNVTPFGIQSSSQFRSDPPPALTSNEYTKDYEEVLLDGGAGSVTRTPARSDAARFFAAVLAVATWNPAVRQVAAAQGSTLSESAQALALMNVAISDGLVAVMETKYHYTFWRPETAIPGFVPFIATPCFPGYGSAHASAGYAAEEIARRIFGGGGHLITLTSPPAVGITLNYTSFKDIARAIDDARVDGGIHFRFDQEAGAVQGREIGKYVFKNMLRRKVN